MPRKSFPKRSRKPPRAHFGPPGAPFRPPGVFLGLLRAHFDPPGALLALPGRSREPLGSLLGPPKTSQNRSLRLSRRPPAPELDFRCILGVILAPCWDPPDLKKQGFRVESVAFFLKNRKEEREAREKREPQASQATENTRREAQTTARRTRAKHHEAQPSQRGESNASIKIASVVGRVQPLLARCARSPGVWSWSVS